MITISLRGPAVVLLQRPPYTWCHKSWEKDLWKNLRQVIKRLLWNLKKGSPDKGTLLVLSVPVEPPAVVCCLFDAYLSQVMEAAPKTPSQSHALPITFFLSESSHTKPPDNEPLSSWWTAGVNTRPNLQDNPSGNCQELVILENQEKRRRLFSHEHTPTTATVGRRSKKALVKRSYCMDSQGTATRHDHSQQNMNLLNSHQSYFFSNQGLKDTLIGRLFSQTLVTLWGHVPRALTGRNTIFT